MAWGSAPVAGSTFLKGEWNMREGFNQYAQSWYLIMRPIEHKQHYLQTKYAQQVDC